MGLDTTTPVVVFRADTYCALGMVRSLGRLGVPVFCVDHDPSALAMNSRYCAGRFRWDFESSPPIDSVNFLIDVAREIGQPPILLPNFDPRNLLVDQHRDLLAEWFLLPKPRPGSIPRLYNKQSLYELCKKTGVPTPESIFPESIDDVLRESPRLQFPLLIKAIDPDRLMRQTGRRMAVVRQQSELRETYRAFDMPGSNNLFLQEFIPGNQLDSWILGVYFDGRGDCRFAMTGQKLRQRPIDGGVTSLGVCAPCDVMVESTCRIARASGYQGIIDADFRYDGRDGTWKLLDVNPRTGANFRLFVDQHGLDVIRALYLDLTGHQIPTIEPHWGRRWLVEDVDFYAMRDYRAHGSFSIGAWLRSLWGVSEMAHIALDDPRPSLAFMLQCAIKLIRGAARRLRRAETRCR